MYQGVGDIIVELSEKSRQKKKVGTNPAVH
jgi:hypothetical protein